MIRRLAMLALVLSAPHAAACAGAHGADASIVDGIREDAMFAMMSTTGFPR